MERAAGRENGNVATVCQRKRLLTVALVRGEDKRLRQRGLVLKRHLRHCTDLHAASSERSDHPAWYRTCSIIAALHLLAAVLTVDSLVWMLLLSQAAALVALLFTLWRLERLRRFVDICAWTDTITCGQTSMSIGHYLARRFNIRVNRGLSHEEAATLRTHLASLSTEQKAARRVLGRPRPVATPPRQTASFPSPLDEFPEEQSLVAPRLSTNSSAS